MEDENKFDTPAYQQEREAENKKRKKVQETLEYAESLAIVFVVMLLLFTFIARPATVDGDSMLPTLENGERLIISHLFYEPSYGDIVVLSGAADGQDGKNLIKRIIATEGQTIDIDFDAGEVYIDGEVLSEPYILENTYLEEGTEFPLTVPQGEIFVMGDNRNGSRDSRSPSVSTVKEEYIVGRVLFRFFPFNRLGKISDTGRLNITAAD